jgi:RNA polymerase sigma-70 factor (sigma-E family)
MRGGSVPTEPRASGFDHYVTAHGTALRRFAYLLTGDYHLGEDLLQEVLVKVYRRWPRQGGFDQPTAYVRKAILHQYLSWRRRASSHEPPVDLSDEVVGRDADYAEALAQRDSLWQTLATLPRRQRAVLVLRFYEDLDDEEIGRLLGCSAGTVRSHASRGLARLRVSIHTVAQQGGI